MLQLIAESLCANPQRFVVLIPSDPSMGRNNAFDLHQKLHQRSLGLLRLSFVTYRVCEGYSSSPRAASLHKVTCLWIPYDS